MTVSKVSRYRGALLGLACGDALGTTLEFKLPGTFAPITDMVGGGTFGLQPGQWTDDTSLALCLAESLITQGEFDPHDQLARYLRWYREGYMSSTGSCFDIGNTTRTALEKYEADPSDPYPGPTDEWSAGNGSLMRVAPVPLFFADDPATAIEKSGESSRTTHGPALAVDACRYFGSLIVGTVQGASKTELLSVRYSPVSGYWVKNPLVEKIDQIAAGSFKKHDPPRIKGTGYVVRALEAALWAFYNSDNFAEGCLKAVNLGDDADTTGAIYGQLAGAFYGEAAIPEIWRARLHGHDLITKLAEGLVA